MADGDSDEGEDIFVHNVYLQFLSAILSDLWLFIRSELTTQ